jgi:hypothetical protein
MIWTYTTQAIGPHARLKANTERSVWSYFRRVGMELTIKTNHGGDGFTESLVFSQVWFESITLSGDGSETSDYEKSDEHEDTTYNQR